MLSKVETPLKHTEFWIETTFVFIFALTLSVTSNNLLVETVTGLFLIFYQHFTVHCILLSFCLRKEKQRPCKPLGSQGAPRKRTVLCAWKLLAGKPFLPLHIAKQSGGGLTADCILLDVRDEIRMASLTLMWAFSNQAELLLCPSNAPSNSGIFVCTKGFWNVQAPYPQGQQCCVLLVRGCGPMAWSYPRV